MSILRFLGLQGHPDDQKGDTETVRRIAQELDRLDPAQARYIAAFAFLLSRVAQSDLEISGPESDIMERIVSEIGGVPPEQAVIVVQIAKTQNRLFGATENYLVSREFENIATREQKMALLECLFAVSASDESVSVVEDREIRQIASELKLDHQDFIKVRSAFRNHLAVLKKDKTE